jgi:hypothetical protein
MVETPGAFGCGTARSCRQVVELSESSEIRWRAVRAQRDHDRGHEVCRRAVDPPLAPDDHVEDQQGGAFMSGSGAARSDAGRRAGCLICASAARGVAQPGRGASRSTMEGAVTPGKRGRWVGSCGRSSNDAVLLFTRRPLSTGPTCICTRLPCLTPEQEAAIGIAPAVAGVSSPSHGHDPTSWPGHGAGAPPTTRCAPGPASLIPPLRGAERSSTIVHWPHDVASQ